VLRMPVVSYKSESDGNPQIIEPYGFLLTKEVFPS